MGQIRPAARFCKWSFNGAPPHRFLIAFGCFHAATTELSSCNRDGLVCKARKVYRLALCRKTLPVLRQCPNFKSHAGVDMSLIKKCGPDLVFSCCTRAPWPRTSKDLAGLFTPLILIFKNCHLTNITCCSVQLKTFLLPSVGKKHLLLGWPKKFF